jgi:hypothetical protein
MVRLSRTTFSFFTRFGVSSTAELTGAASAGATRFCFTAELRISSVMPSRFRMGA